MKNHQKELCTKKCKERMEKPINIGNYLNIPSWFVFFGSLFLIYTVFVLSGQYSDMTMVILTHYSSFSFTHDDHFSIKENEGINPVSDKKDKVKPFPKQPELDPCCGKYIYIHDLPKRFNDDIIKNCSSLLKWTNMCEPLSNVGFGPLAKNFNGVLQNQSWYVTNQFVLEIIFHNRMRNYKCLTKNSSLASAIYVPFFPGLEVGRYLFSDDLNTSIRDSASLDLVKWLREKPEWGYMWGKDHFFVCGRVTWDFRRQTDNIKDWGNKLLEISEAKNMTILGIESNYLSNNEFAIPYPTYFHPSNDKEVFEWEKKLRKQRRPHLFSFVGGPRPNLIGSIRGKIIDQCIGSGKKCRLLDCSTSAASYCHEPAYVMEMLQKSVFCLQPPGDSFTRRSTFDSILAGCIPVFFHPKSSYSQYIWHLPKNHSKYSVFIPEDVIKNDAMNNTKIEMILERIPRLQVLAMREEVIKLVPRVVYANPKAQLENVEDAFDVAVNEVLRRVHNIKKKKRHIASGFLGREKKNIFYDLSA